MNERICLAIDLKDDPAAIEAYEHWHRSDNAWPEVVASIADAGIAEMEIYRTGTRLFMVMEVTPAFDAAAKAAADAANPRVQDWIALMTPLLAPMPWAPPGALWAETACIYRLSEASKACAGTGPRNRNGTVD